MSVDKPISDMLVLDLSWQAGRLTVVKDDDHVLRRFGQVDIIGLDQGQQIEVFRQQADEIWALFSGQATIQLEDQRQDSPSMGVTVSLVVDQEVPKAVLVPFGVACIVTGGLDGTRFLRIGTHHDTSHPQDRFGIL